MKIGDHVSGNKVDAIIFEAGHPNGLTQEATTDCRAKLVRVAGQPIDRLVATYPYYIPLFILGGMYVGNPGDVPTIGTRAVLVSTSDQPNERAYATTLNAEGFLSARGRLFSAGEIHLLRKRWNIPTVKINGTGCNPLRWPDGTYSVRGAAAALSISPQSVFKWLQKRRLSGRQLAKGMPWQITLSSSQIAELRMGVRRTNQSTKEAS
jgi:hypothetical protein